MSQPCPRVLATGYCDTTSCNLNHKIPSCTSCSLLFTTQALYEAHLKTKKHAKKVSGRSDTYYCTVCETYVGSHSWMQHVNGSPHTSRAKVKGISNPRAIEKVVPDRLPGHTFCGACKEHIQVRLWRKHLLKQRHQECQRFVAYSAALDEADRDKNGVTVNGDLDFDVIDPAAARVGKTKVIRIQCSAQTSHISLVECSLRSKGAGRQSPFTAKILSANRTLTSRSSVIEVEVQVKQTYDGRAEDYIEFLFENAAPTSRFLIARPLNVIVGSKSDHENLKPAAPFKPRPRVVRQPEKDLKVVEGVKPPVRLAIPYVGTLPQYGTPRPLTDLLACKLSIADCIRQLKDGGFPSVFHVQSYIRREAYLLWIEEHRMEYDLGLYDMSSAKLTKRGGRLYHLPVPGLAEKRPSVLIGDRLHVQRSSTGETHWFEGYVHDVSRDEVGLMFKPSFQASSTDSFNVRFTLNRIPLRRQHHAINSPFMEERILFPTKRHLLLNSIPIKKMKYNNPLVASNEPQMQAVKSIVQSPPGSPPFVVFGPPGTGKTVTIVEAILQLIQQNPDSRVLVCAPSNSAADLITERLGGKLTKEVMFRMIAPSRMKGTVPSSVLPFTFLNPSGFFSVDKKKVPTFRVVVSTCVSASIVSGIGISPGHYSHIFVDEAGQATEPEVMIAIKTMANKKTNVVLSGDPKQLGPVIRSTVARSLGLEISFIERLMGRSEVYDETRGHGLTVVKLIKNFRSHRTIMHFPNVQFYGGDLRPHGDPKIINSYLDSSHVGAPGFAIVFHAVSGKDDREASSPSFFNIDEITLAKKYVQELLRDKKIPITEKDIGVITPYHAQCVKTRKALKDIASGVKVGSVEEFQGQERRVIIISTVRSSQEFVQYDLKHTLGFVANPRRFNVAVTRAQALLIVIGDPNVLSLDPLWREFLNFIHRYGGWKGPPPTWDTSANVDEAGGYDRAARESAQADMVAFTRKMEEMTLEGLQDRDDLEEDEDEFFDVSEDQPWVEVDHY